MKIAAKDGEVTLTAETDEERAALAQLAEWEQRVDRLHAPEAGGEEPGGNSPLFGLDVTLFPVSGRLVIVPANAWWNYDD